MAETPYPLLRGGRRRRSRRIAIPRSRIRVVALAVLAAGLILIAAVVFRTAPPADPVRSLSSAAAALARGNYSAAQNAALTAVAAAPPSGRTSGDAHLMLARAYLMMGDGLAAEAEVVRAQAAGVAAARIDGLRARALFLQHDLDGAMAAASAAPDDDALARRTRARVLAERGQQADAEQLLAADRDPAGLVDLAIIRLRADDIGGAARPAAQAVRAAPRDPAALTVQGEVVRLRYGPTAALRWFEAALQRDAYHVPALLAYAATLGDVGRHADMLAATRKALMARPNDPQALYLQAVLAVRARNLDLAQSLFHRAGAIDRTIPAAALVSGMIDYDKGRFEQAIGTWRDLVARQPMNLIARRALAAALLRSGDATAAIDVLRPMVNRGDADSYTLTLAARAAERLGDRIAAGRWLDRAAMGAQQTSAAFAIDGTLASFAQDAAQAPDDPALGIALVRALLTNGRAAAGIDLARQWAAKRPGDPAMQRALGDALATTGQGAAAIDAYTRAADLTFDEPTMLRLVDALGRSGRAQDAAATLSLYLAQNPQSIVGQRLRAHWLVATGGGAQAIEPLEAVRHMVGNRNVALLTDLALAYVAADEPTVARRYGQAAYRLSPLTVAAIDAYGVALAADGDTGGARQLFAKALAIDPANTVVQGHARGVAR